MIWRRATLVVVVCIVVSVPTYLLRHGPVLGQTDEIKIARDRMGEFFRFTAAFGEHYHSYFKDKYTEGAFVLDASFLKEFNASAGDVRKVIVALKENKAPVHTRILSDILSAALDDELEGRGLEYKGKPNQRS